MPSKIITQLPKITFTCLHLWLSISLSLYRHQEKGFMETSGSSFPANMKLPKSIPLE